MFATLKRAPLSLEPQLQAMAGAAHVETAQAQVVPISIANVVDPIVGLLLGMDPLVPQRLNKVNLRSGRMLSARRTGASEGAEIDQLDRLLARFGGTHAHGRDLQMSNAMLNSEITQQWVMGTVLPSIFLAVAAFLLNVVLGRQIAT